MFFSRRDGLERTRNKVDDVITAVGDKIIECDYTTEEYAKVIEAYVDLVGIRMDMDQ